MARLWLLLCAAWMCGLPARAQEIRIDSIDKPVSALSGAGNLHTPLDAFLTINDLMIRGEESRWRAISSKSVWERLPGPDAPDKIIPENQQEALRRKTIFEVVTYRDSLATVVTDFGSSSMVELRFLLFERGAWRNFGGDLQMNLESARRKFTEWAADELLDMRARDQLTTLRSDTAAFTDYLAVHTMAPKEYLLEKLKAHRLVIYGERHKRKTSWQLLLDLLHDERFEQHVGTIFMELPSFTLGRMNEFLSSPTLRSDIALEILRNEQIFGWEDRGMYELMVATWQKNRTLSEAQRIALVPVDYQLNWHRITTPEEYALAVEQAPERNAHMAGTIAETFAASSDTRNALFIVGFNHARKDTFTGSSPVPAGKLLADHFSAEEVFAIFPHVPVVSNTGVVFGQLRGGLFDALLGDRPQAFDLAGSPFGAEPLDVFYGVSAPGTFAQHFDGYLFLGLLADKTGEWVLPELFSEEFVVELRRQATISDSRMGWYDLPLDELSRQAILQKLEKSAEKRWDASPI